MKNKNIKVTIGASLILRETLYKILQKEVEENGKLKIISRNLPFRLSYRLTKNLNILNKVFEAFNKKKLILLATYGDLEDDGKNVSLKDPEKINSYKKDLVKLLETPISQDIMLLEEDDLDLIKDNIDITIESMNLLMKYLIADQDSLEKLEKEINIKLS